MTTRKRPAAKIGPGKKRSGKRRIHREGGTQSDLTTWRSLDKRTRTYLKRQYRGNTDYSLRAALKRVRKMRRSVARGKA